MNDCVFNADVFVGPVMDVSAYNGCFYAIQNYDQCEGGRVCSFDRNGKILSEFSGIGNARQICIKNGMAVVSAREDGLFIFSVGEDRIKLLSHYRTVEFATGVTLYSHYAFVSCRQYGVEIIDLSDPASPRYISVIRIGEVQSACVYDGFLYGGVWGTMNVAVIDIRDMANPKLVKRIELSGRGDGVAVCDGILYAAIGQHRRGIINLVDENDPCFGEGNGFEVFDVKDPTSPKHIKTVFTDRAYYPGFDTWRPYVTENRLYVTNSVLGLYVYDKTTLEPLSRYTLQITAEGPDAVVGIAASRGRIAVAASRSGIHFIDDPGADAFREFDAESDDKVDPEPFCSVSDNLRTVYSSGGFISAVTELDGGFVVSAASEGMIFLDANGKEKRRVPTDGFCVDIASRNGVIYAANSKGGLCIYGSENGFKEPLSRLSLGLPVVQLALDGTGGYAMIVCGSTNAALVDVSDKFSPRVVCVRTLKHGPLYGENFAPHLLENGSVIMFWHRDGLVFFDPSEGEKINEVYYDMHRNFLGGGPENGIDTDGKNIYYDFDGGYILLPIRQGVYADDLEVYKPDIPIHGKLTYHDGKIIATERARGLITVTDVSDIRHPFTVLSLTTNASLHNARIIGGKAYIPGGRYGLLALDF